MPVASSPGLFSPALDGSKSSTTEQSYMTVIEIHKDHTMALAGKPWQTALAEALAVGGKVADIQHGSIDKERANRPTDGTAGQRPHLSVDHVWLREVNKRA